MSLPGVLCNIEMGFILYSDQKYEYCKLCRNHITIKNGPILGQFAG